MFLHSSCLSQRWPSSPLIHSRRNSIPVASEEVPAPANFLTTPRSPHYVVLCLLLCLFLYLCSLLPYRTWFVSKLKADTLFMHLYAFYTYMQDLSRGLGLISGMPQKFGLPMGSLN